MIMISEADTSHLIWKTAEGLDVRHSEIGKAGRVLNHLPTEVWATHLDHFRSVWGNIFMQEDHLALETWF